MSDGKVNQRALLEPLCKWCVLCFNLKRHGATHKLQFAIAQQRSRQETAFSQRQKVGLQVEIFSQDEMRLICHPAHPFAQRYSVRLVDLHGEKLIAFEPDVPTRKVIDRHLREHAVQIEHTMEFDNIETVKRGVEIENALSIVPSESVNVEVAAGTLCRIDLEGRNLWRPLGVIRRRTKAITPPMREMVRLLKSGSETAPVA